MKEIVTNLENIRSNDPYKKLRAVKQLRRVADIFGPV